MANVITMRNIKEFLDAWFAAKPTKEMVAALIKTVGNYLAAKAAA